MSNDSQFSFRGQREDETIIRVIHRHPWALAKAGLYLSAGLVIVLLMFVWFQLSRPSTWTLFILGPILVLYGFYAWFVWWNNIYLLTDQRVIIISQRGLWSRRIEDYSLDKIQSVASDTGGAAGTILNFGTVMLAIMGIKEPVELKFVEDPYAIQEKVVMAMNQREHHKPLVQKASPRSSSAEATPEATPVSVVSPNKKPRRLIQN